MPIRQPRSRCRLQETRAGLLEASIAESSGPHGPGVAFRHPRSASSRLLARIGSALARIGGAHTAGLLPAVPPRGSGERTGRDGRHSCEPVSRTVGRQRQAFGPGAGRSHVRCWIQTSRQGQRRAIIGTRPICGDNPARRYRRRARPDQRLGWVKRSEDPTPMRNRDLCWVIADARPNLLRCFTALRILRLRSAVERALQHH